MQLALTNVANSYTQGSRGTMGSTGEYLRRLTRTKFQFIAPELREAAISSKSSLGRRGGSPAATAACIVASAGVYRRLCIVQGCWVSLKYALGVGREAACRQLRDSRRRSLSPLCLCILMDSRFVASRRVAIRAIRTTRRIHSGCAS